MKKYIYIISILLTFLACQEDFLEEKAVTVLTQDFYKTSEGLEALVNGTYQVFRFKSDYNSGNLIFGSANDCEVLCRTRMTVFPTGFTGRMAGAQMQEPMVFVWDKC